MEVYNNYTLVYQYPTKIYRMSFPFVAKVLDKVKYFAYHKDNETRTGTR